MLPLGHVAVAYLGYLLYAVSMRRPLPLTWGLLPLATASQLPDLIDKPLAFAGVLTSSRSLGHSFLTALVLIGLVTWSSHVVAASEHLPSRIRQLAGATPAPFTIGYLAHLLGDALTPIRTRQYDELAFALWPLLPAPQYPAESVAPTVRLVQVYQQPGLLPDRRLVVAAGVVFCVIQGGPALLTALRRR